MEEKIIFDVGWDTKLITNPEFILREIGGQCLLIPVVSEGPLENSMMTMNETAAYMWRQFSMGKTPNEVYENAIHDYEDDSEDHRFINESVYRFVHECVRLDVLLPERNPGKL